MKNRFLVSCIISIWISGVISVVTVPSASASDDVRVAVMGAVGVRTERATMPYDLPDSGALDGKTVTSIDAGNTATCVVASGEIFCWGDSYTNGTSQNSSVPVAINTSGVLKGKIISSVSVGGNFACALASGAVFCWGVNNVGQLGNSSTEYSTTPVAVTATGVLAGKLVMSISLGSAHACMLVAGSIYCWGSNLSNQLGTKSNLGTLNYSTTPVPTESSGALLGKTVTAVSSGNSHTCALASGQVFCWGENSSSQLGDGTNSWSAVPVMVNTTGAMTGKTVTAISAGQSHTCAIASGAAFCWGYGSSGQLGNGSVNYSNQQPTAVVSTGVLAGKTLSSINSGVSSTCAIASGAAFCWGWGGALGNNSSVISSVPVAVDTGLVKPGLTYEVSVGAGHTCALTSGTANCWGQAESGQLGNNSFNNSLVPTPVVTKATLSGKTIDSISSSNSHTCVTAVGKAFCWGQGNAGQLGNGSNRNSATPVEVSTTGALVGKSITAISTGSQHTCAIAAGSAFCWGQNREGQLGNGTKVASPVPVAVDASGVLAGKVITSIYAGGSFSCAIASGQVYCWGSNAGGQIGVEVAKDFFGAYVQVSFLTPVAVDTKGVLKGKIISSFAFHSQGSTVSVLSDKRVYSWGGSARTPIENSVTNSGDLKDQDIIQASGGFYSELYGCVMTSNGVYCSDEISRETTTKPVKINTESTLGGRPISQVFSNGQNSCVISVGSLYCWGQNENGQLGNHSVKNSAIPVPVETSETLKDREVLAVTFSGDVTYVLHRAMSAEAKAAAEKAAVEEVTKAKTAAEKAAADAADALRAELQAKAKAKAEAEAAAKARTAAEIKAANEAKAAAKAKADAEANAKAEAESALVRAINDLKSATATIAKLNDSNAELNRIISSLSASNKNQQDQINALNARINELLTPKPTTIVCAKGTTTKTVKGINPVCPAGYKKK